MQKAGLKAMRTEQVSSISLHRACHQVQMQVTVSWIFRMVLMRSYRFTKDCYVRGAINSTLINYDTGNKKGNSSWVTFFKNRCTVKCISILHTTRLLYNKKIKNTSSLLYYLSHLLEERELCFFERCWILFTLGCSGVFIVANLTSSSSILFSNCFMSIFSFSFFISVNVPSIRKIKVDIKSMIAVAPTKKVVRAFYLAVQICSFDFQDSIGRQKQLL